jgi:hypothetical protein
MIYSATEEFPEWPAEAILVQHRLSIVPAAAGRFRPSLAAKCHTLSATTPG